MYADRLYRIEGAIEANTAAIAENRTAIAELRTTVSSLVRIVEVHSSVSCRTIIKFSTPIKDEQDNRFGEIHAWAIASVFITE